MVMDILKPDAGTIAVDGSTEGGALRNATGYLPEERGLYRKSRVDHVISYFAALKGMKRSDALRAAEPLLERFDLQKYRKSHVEELSKGNQQKLQFVVSVLHAPPLLVLDELFSGLDPVNQELMKEALLDLRQDNRAIVFSTHQMEHAEKLCDELILINRGEVVLEGTPQQIKRERGHNSVRVEYEGDGAFLSSLPGVEHADIGTGYAELQLTSGADSNALLRAVLERLQVSSFARVSPSLHRIFIDTVGSASANGQPQPRDVLPPPAADRRVKTAVFLSLSLLVGLIAAAALGASALVTGLLAGGFVAAVGRVIHLRAVAGSTGTCARPLDTGDKTP
jgi:ABC-2 type transport system ATP-binding protein